MTEKVQVNVPIPTELINAKINAAVAEALGKDPAALVDAVVKTAMQQKNHPYDKTTIFQEAVNGMIRDAAKAAFNVWLEEHRAMIEKSLLVALRSKDGLAQYIANRVIDGLAKNFEVYATIRVSDND